VPPASWAHPQLRQSALPKSCLGCYSASEWVRFVGRPLRVSGRFTGKLPHRMGGPAWPGPSKAAHVIGLNRRSCAANRCKSLPWDCVVLRKIPSRSVPPPLGSLRTLPSSPQSARSELHVLFTVTSIHRPVVQRGARRTYVRSTGPPRSNVERLRKRRTRHPLPVPRHLLLAQWRRAGIR
jgi:hypothetical protein